MYVSLAAVRRWGDRQALLEGTACFARGGVGELEVDGDRVRATVTLGGRPVRTRFRVLPDATVDSECPCPHARERGLICVHVVAAGLYLADQIEDPARERAERIAARRRHEDREGPPPGQVQRRPASAAGAIPATLRLRLDGDLRDGWARDAIVVTAQVLYQDQKRRLDKVSPDLPLAFTDGDRDLLYVWEDLGGGGGTTPGSLTLTREPFLDLLRVLAPGTLARQEGGPALQLDAEARLSQLTVRLRADTGTLRVVHQMEPPPRVVLAARRQAWALLAEDHLAPLDAVLPASLWPAYAPEGTDIPRAQVLAFLRLTLPSLEAKFVVDCDVDDTAFQFEPGTPGFALDLEGTAESISITLFAIYGETRVRAVVRAPVADAGYPLPGRPLVFATRHAALEAEALDWLGGLGPLVREGDGIRPVSGGDTVLAVLEEVMPAAQQRGWRVNCLGVLEQLAAEADWIRPDVTIQPANTAGWFAVRIVYRDPRGEVIPPARVEAALTPGPRPVGREGRLLLANRALLRALQLACLECLEAEEDPEAIHGRISDVHAGYFASILALHPDIRVTAHDDWFAQVRRQNERMGLDPVALGDPLDGLLRPYQHEGVAWLQFLEKGGYAGILADEMGLGKTLQALAWLQLERVSAAARGLPSLVVCPTSLLENWAREAARFTPSLRVRVVAGADRHRDAESPAAHELLITSYALLRRDSARYATRQFAAVVLDEAQHIKNRSTQNAQAARQLKAVHRLVLTGTPVENAVGDLWSIFEFLMPGYLGSEARFQEAFERPIRAGGRAAEAALARLRHKIQPFLLRRLKTAVATDLPPRLTRTATCVMGSRQAALYRELVDTSRATLEAAVGARGFEASRMTVLKTLLRLRQCCCHPALLSADALAEDATPSAKLELFFELLDEAMDGGQRVLVFSQFVTMLSILRRELESRGIAYAYLDGATRNRQAEVDRFQQDTTCPLFLISLKAGGSGLNLTGASVVIHFDPWWNPAVEDQATDRAHRIGQTRSVYSIKLVTAGTVEEQVLELQSRKRLIIDAALGGVGGGLSALSWEDVQRLLT